MIESTTTSDSLNNWQKKVVKWDIIKKMGGSRITSNPDSDLCSYVHLLLGKWRGSEEMKKIISEVKTIIFNCNFFKKKNLYIWGANNISSAESLLLKSFTCLRQTSMTCEREIEKLQILRIRNALWTILFFLTRSLIKIYLFANSNFILQSRYVFLYPLLDSAVNWPLINVFKSKDKHFQIAKINVYM